MFQPVYLTSVARKAILTVFIMSLTSTGFAGGGSGGGSAPAGGGGGKACSVISSLKVSSGPSQWTFPWDDVTVTYILKGCAPGFVPAGRITVTNLDPVSVNAWWSPVLTGQIVGLAGRFRPDSPAVTPYNANVRVDFVVVDPATGAVVESQSVTLVTPPKP